MGKMKDEVEGKIITHFAVLRSKCYTYIIEAKPSTKKCKGVKKSVVKGISFKDFETYLLFGNQMYQEQPTFRTTNHTITTRKQRKLVLSREDTKRVIRPDYISTYAKGHYNVGWNEFLGYVGMK